MAEERERKRKRQAKGEEDSSPHAIDDRIITSFSYDEWRMLELYGRHNYTVGPNLKVLDWNLAHADHAAQLPRLDHLQTVEKLRLWFPRKPLNMPIDCFKAFGGNTESRSTAEFLLQRLPVHIFPKVKVLALPRSILSLVCQKPLSALRVLITNTLPPDLSCMPQLEELHIDGAAADQLASFKSSHPQLRRVHLIDQTNPDPFTAVSRGLPLDFPGQKASGQLASLSTLHLQGEPVRLCAATKPQAERLRRLACTELFASDPARHAALKKVKIALLDSGVNFAHSDLAGTLTGLESCVDGEMPWIDQNGHGTHCAGILVGAHTGVACGVQLYVAKVAGREGVPKMEDVAKGVKWAIEKGVDIISMSLGISRYHDGLHCMIQKAIKRGIVVVCAAGNEGSTEQFNIRFPATIPGVVRVGSVDAHGRASGFTSVGGAHIDAAGPGEHILSTWIKSPLEPAESTFLVDWRLNNWYHSISGTSMATPFITGIIAWLLAYDRALETTRPKRLLNAHCVKDLLGRLCFNPSGDLGAGRGTLNLKNILELPAQFDYLLSQIC